MRIAAGALDPDAGFPSPAMLGLRRPITGASRSTKESAGFHTP
jgi:hypothetical protein